LELANRFSYEYSDIKFSKIRPAAAVLKHADGQVDMTEVISAFATMQTHLHIISMIKDKQKQLPSLVMIAFTLPYMFDAAWYREFF